ncbi:hypothetical protein B0181_07115 [Moraxella caviae]|uniref:Uncharacterized protein n=1 Tax=Moraxella caviae TaxID=34060 RepID=A0A1T0A2E4_9GAMM|nr:hypothetical protein [Moraxella caviae]OOR89441.1 hypothetical protein B0181_07115 [Moraxella caviae]STZ09836.1 Uncharacterised protein [Moraxella caviae]
MTPSAKPTNDTLAWLHRQAFCDFNANFTDLNADFTQDSHPKTHVFWLQAHLPNQSNSSIHQSILPNIAVCATFIANTPKNCAHLLLSYYLSDTDWLTLAPTSPTHTTRQDYLWEQNCLECFVEFGDNVGYREVNISFDGAFNVYHFLAYRAPAVMPPVQDSHASVQFIHSTQAIPHWHSYHAVVSFDDNPPNLHKIHPTAILYHGSTPIFYAEKHATPPDFHDRRYWRVASE